MFAFSGHDLIVLGRSLLSQKPASPSAPHPAHYQYLIFRASLLSNSVKPDKQSRYLSVSLYFLQLHPAPNQSRMSPEKNRWKFFFKLKKFTTGNCLHEGLESQKLGTAIGLLVSKTYYYILQSRSHKTTTSATSATSITSSYSTNLVKWHWTSWTTCKRILVIHCSPHSHIPYLSSVHLAAAENRK